MSQTLSDELRADIAACGYFPELIADAVALALGPEEERAHLVQHEATFNRDEIHRHLSVFVLTPTRLLGAHTDEAGEGGASVGAATTTESVPLRGLNSVAVTQVVDHPERYGRGRSPLVETWLSVSWGTMRRLDLEPAHCGDPSCEADHGYTGSLAGDDLTVRMSAAADGADQVAKLVRFGTALQLATGAKASA